MRRHTLLVVSVLSAMSMLLAACGTSAQEAHSASAADALAQDQLSGTISVSGAFALYPMMTVWADEFQKLHPDVQFDVQGGGAGKGMTDTIAGAVDIGMISRSIKPEEEAQDIFWGLGHQGCGLPDHQRFESAQGSNSRQGDFTGCLF